MWIQFTVLQISSQLFVSCSHYVKFWQIFLELNKSWRNVKAQGKKKKIHVVFTWVVYSAVYFVQKNVILNFWHFHVVVSVPGEQRNVQKNGQPVWVVVLQILTFAFCCSPCCVIRFPPLITAREESRLEESDCNATWGAFETFWNWI